MNRKWMGLVVLVCVAASLLNLSSCTHSQELVSIQIQPGTTTFGASNIPVIDNAGLNVQLQALGSYTHPPVTKDITNQVTWSNNSTQMFTLSSSQPGLLTVTGDECGGALISATIQTNTSAGGISSQGAIVAGYMNANVTCFTGNGSGSGPAVTITFGSTGSGTVSSSPGGLFCTAPSQTVCADTFPSGTNLTLTATPTPPSTTASWQGCPVITTTEACSFILETNTTITAIFQ
jgi:hypothetical protein